MDLKAAKVLLGRRIEQLRRDKAGLGEEAVSYGRLAAALNDKLQRKPKLAHGTVQKWEKGKGHPDPWALIELAKLAGVSVEQFVYPPSQEESGRSDAEPIDPSIVQPEPRPKKGAAKHVK